jgi:MoaA/NifB/PqqE/SkfB family radical SAM enzyme
MFNYRTYYSIGKALFTKRSPYYIQYYITGRCNLRCRQCNIVETNSRIEEIDLEHIKKVAKNLRKVGVGIVLLTGGEPFIREDLPDIVSAFTKENINVRLQTAGAKFATKEKLKDCYDAGARDINVSLDSLDYLKADYINAIPGSGKSAIEVIERISDVFRNKSAILSFGTVLSAFNYREIPAILEFAKRIGWYVSLVPVHITNLEIPKGFRSYDKDFLFEETQYKQLKSLIDQLIQMRNQGFPLFDSERFLRSGFSFLKGEGVKWRYKGICDSPDLYFAIRADGAFSPCCDYVLENPIYVYEDEFVNAYKSGEIRNRQDMKDIVNNCSGCHYGSYPEVTISVRDLKAFIERMRLVFSSGPGKLRTANVKNGFFEEIEKIKELYPEVYKTTNWIRAEVVEKLKMWENKESRSKILKLDREIRKKQLRERGVGKDIIIGPE